MQLEDGSGDILGKAMRGKRLTPLQLMELSGLSMLEVDAALAGNYRGDGLRALAQVLGLHADALLAIAANAYSPQVKLPAGVIGFTTAYPVPGYAEMTVNAWLLEAGSGAAVLVDAGADATPVIAHCREHGLQLDALLLTHAHADHVAGLPALRAQFPSMRLFAPEAEPVGDSVPLPPDGLRFGQLWIESRATSGHSPGGTSYIASAAGMPTIACVGDALFAGSVGGIRGDYAAALACIAGQILVLPAATLICPGHGPATTVAAEQLGNPFFAA